MKVFERMKSGITISTVAHAAILLWALVVFAVKPFSVPPAESMPVDIISISEFSQMMAGAKNAPKKEAPKPLVEKVAEPKPVENVTAKVAEKELTTASAPKEAPPEAKPPEPKPKPAEAKKEPEKKSDVESLQKADKKEPKKEEAKPLPPKKPEPKKDVAEKKKPQQEQSKFDADRIAALLDKRQPTRLAAAGDTLNSAPALGSRTGNAPNLSATYLQALVAKLQDCWTADGGSLTEEKLIVPVTLRFDASGNLASAPLIEMQPRNPRERAQIERLTRAIVGCQPFEMLPRPRYVEWKELAFNFNPEPPR